MSDEVTDAIEELCELVRSAGGSMTLYGKPIEATELVRAAEDSIVERTVLRVRLLALAPLWSNIATAAALTTAYRIGFDQGFNATGEGFNGEYCPRLTPDGYVQLVNGPNCEPYDWRPGCGRVP